jgi:hypothetical protein
MHYDCFHSGDKLVVMLNQEWEVGLCRSRCPDCAGYDRGAMLKGLHRESVGDGALRSRVHSKIQRDSADEKRILDFARNDKEGGV